MNVLFLSPFAPYPPSFGGSVRIFHLMRQVARRHRVVSLSYRSPWDPELDRSGLEGIAARAEEVVRPAGSKRLGQLRSLFSSRSYQDLCHVSAPMQRALDRLVREESIDCIAVEFSQMAGFRFPPGPALLIDEHNVEWDLIRREAQAAGSPLRRLYQLRESRKFRREEVAHLRRADAACVTSDRDRQLLLRDAPELEIEVVPNGVDIDHFRAGDDPPDPNALVFTGAMHYHPNAQAAEWFVTRVLPLIRRKVPEAHFIGAGGRLTSELERLQSESVHFTGFVDDMREYFQRAAVCVVPLLVGGGTRFKIVEGMAATRPVVSTTLGCEGIPAAHGEHLLLADEPQAFADAVVEVLSDRQRAAGLALAGRRFAEEHFSWDSIGERMLAAIEGARGQGRAAA